MVCTSRGESSANTASLSHPPLAPKSDAFSQRSRQYAPTSGRSAAPCGVSSCDMPYADAFGGESAVYALQSSTVPYGGAYGVRTP